MGGLLRLGRVGGMGDGRCGMWKGGNGGRVKGER